MRLRSAYFSLKKKDDDILPQLAERLDLAGEIPDQQGQFMHYEVAKVPQGGLLMIVAGLTSGLLGIGSGALYVIYIISPDGFPQSPRGKPRTHLQPATSPSVKSNPVVSPA